MIGESWEERGFERGSEYHIARGPWVIVRGVKDCLPSYTLYRGAEMHGTFPDAHEAAVHADMVEAEAA